MRFDYDEAAEAGYLTVTEGRRIHHVVELECGVLADIADTEGAVVGVEVWGVHGAVAAERTAYAALTRLAVARP